MNRKEPWPDQLDSLEGAMIRHGKAFMTADNGYATYTLDGMLLSGSYTAPQEEITKKETVIRTEHAPDGTVVSTETQVIPDNGA